MYIIFFLILEIVLSATFVNKSDKVFTL